MKYIKRLYREARSKITELKILKRERKAVEGIYILAMKQIKLKGML